MVTGGSSSSVAIAQCEECQKAGVVFMAAATHSNATTGKNGHRHCFRWYNNAHQTAKILGRTLAGKYGKKAKYAFLYADYTWGMSVQESMKAIIEKQGGSVILVQPTKPGLKSFLSHLVKVKKLRPDVLVLVLFGKDMINCMNQADKMNTRKEMDIVLPVMELNLARAIGPKLMEGVITTMCWYHGLEDRFDGSKRFVGAFKKEYKRKPGNTAAVAWVDMFQYADAVERAGSFDAPAVIKALEGHEFTLLGGGEHWRDWDHQGIHPTYVVVGKSPSKMADEWDLFKIIDLQEGEELARTREENPVQLESLDKAREK